jgi:hypothetical protein
VVFLAPPRCSPFFFVGTAFNLHVARMESSRPTQFLAKSCAGTREKARGGVLQMVGEEEYDLC